MVIQVAVAVIINDDDEILISRRSAKQHQGDKWEFPGGKVEADESVESALKREIKEELDIDVQSATFFTHITHEYLAVDPKESKTVKLEVYEVREWSGEPKGMENQPTRWVRREELAELEFPTANKAIIELLLK